MPANVHYSRSTWQQPPPLPISAARTELCTRLAREIVARYACRLRICVDGRTGAGKTSFANELAAKVAIQGRPAFRASLDDFKRPWSERHRYDRLSGEGYYQNAFDIDAIQKLLLDPAAPGGDGRCALCSIDPITQIDHSAGRELIPLEGVLIVDGVFALRPELLSLWDVSIWLEVDSTVALARGIARDLDREGDRAVAAAVHQTRYAAADEMYQRQCAPRHRAAIVIDNTDLSAPWLIRSDLPIPVQ